MSNANSILYFVSQTYRQVQLSVEKGTEHYTYGDFNRQFQELLDASGDEEYTRSITILLVEEAARLKQTTDYLRQEMAFETKSSSTGSRPRTSNYNEIDLGGASGEGLESRRVDRRKN